MELTPIELENNLGPDSVTGKINRVPWKAYDIDEVDALLAEKDKEIEKYKTKYMELAKDHDHAVQACCDANKEIESLKASHYAEMVDAGMRERRLRRALYIALALKAHFRWWWAHVCQLDEYGRNIPNVNEIQRLGVIMRICDKSLRKCRSKAKEYK